jgi:hypothetical protein
MKKPLERKLLNPDAEYHLPEPQTIEDELLRELWELASEWLKTKESILAVRFHMAYLELLSHKWEGAFDVDESLLYESMREAYPSIFKGIPSFTKKEIR